METLLYNNFIIIIAAERNENDEESGEDDEVSRKVKPWGDSKHYCPVALKELDVLWPGSDDYCLKCVLLQLILLQLLFLSSLFGYL